MRSASRGRASPGTAASPSRCASSTASARERRLERRRARAARARRRGRRAGARALVPQLGARCGRGLDRAPGARARRRAEGRRGARPAHALGLLLGARHALVLVAPAARAGLGAGRRRLPRALPPARRQPLAGVLAAVRDPPARRPTRARGCARTAASLPPTGRRIASGRHEHDRLRDDAADVPAARAGRLRVHARRGRALGGAASRASSRWSRSTRTARAGARSASASSRAPRGASPTRSRASASRPASAPS